MSNKLTGTGPVIFVAHETDRWRVGHHRRVSAAIQMVFGTDPHLRRARELIESEESERLRYACLELRLALERIAYKKLELRLDKISLDEVRAWQPRRAIEGLMELVDEHLDQDATLRVAEEDEYGVRPPDDRFRSVGTTKGVDPKKIGKYWQKLSSYLHIQMPKAKNAPAPEPDWEKIRKDLRDIADDIESLTANGMDFHFSQTVTLTCHDCGQSIVRNANLVQDGSVVECQNPSCIASYVTHIEEYEYVFEPNRVNLECKTCGSENWVWVNLLLNMDYRSAQLVRCQYCQARMKAVWMLQYTHYDNQNSDAPDESGEE